MSTGSSSASDNDEQISTDEGRQWEDVEPDVEQISVISLFSESKFPDVSSMLQHCKDEHDFDLVTVKKQLGVYVLCPCLEAPPS